MSRFHASGELDEIRAEMLELLHRARKLVSKHGTKREAASAEAYWHAHIAAALGDKRFASRYDTTMLTTVTELAEEPT